MVFSNLGAHEKDAFFTLLDEYFASRPELFAKLAGSDGPSEAATQEATSRIVTAGLRNVPKSSPYHSAATNPHVSSAIGKVAAASLAFNNRSQPQDDSQSGSKNPPPAPPRRSPDPGAPAPKSSVSSTLVSVRKFGSDVDTSSAKNMFNSLRGSTANKSVVHPQPEAPAAFGAKKNNFGPPPVRRVAADNASASPPPPPPPPPTRRPEPEDDGEWAEVIYDYNGDDPGDLDIQANQRVKIIERTSDDWWTGELNGKRGLFPASYVKAL
ncbi:hypothetical protein ONZ45_g4104 [Pleurotus djamor]|nr:hypothetical protein ONZ45_g4104 [Pleurotus djamor]